MMAAKIGNNPNYEIITNIPPIHYESLLKMIHRAFDEHLKNGLRFTCSFYTIDDLKQKILSGYCFMALSDNNTILGISSFSHINKRGKVMKTLLVSLLKQEVLALLQPYIRWE